jgi:integrase
MFSEPVPVIDLLSDQRVYEEQPVPTKPNIRLGEAVHTYLGYRSRRGFAAGTMIVDRRLLWAMVRDVGDLQVRNLKPSHLTNWFYGPGGLHDHHKGKHNGGRLMPPIQEATHNQYRSRLAVFFDWMTKEGMVKTDLLTDVPFVKVPAKRRIQPKPSQLLAFLDSAQNPRDRAYLAFAVNSALRANEILGIRVGDVDLDKNWCRVDLSKGGEKKHRQPITADLARELATWLEVYEKELGRPLQDDDLLFPSRSGGKISHYTTEEDGTRKMHRTPWVWNPQSRMRRAEGIVHTALRAAGITETRYEGTHTIRRAVARAYFDSMASDIGYDAALRTVSALLHHKSTATTERYLGLSSEIERRDKSMRGMPFLSAMSDDVQDITNVKKKGKKAKKKAA